MIRNAIPADLEFIYHLYMHPKVNPFLLYEWMPKEEFEPIYFDLLGRGVKYVFEEHGVSAGMFKLVPNSYRSAHVVYLGGVAIHPDFSGRGLGLQMMEEMKEYCRHNGFLRIELSTGISNAAALKLYEKAGFAREGILRKYGYLATEKRYVDEVMMAYVE